MEIFSHFYSSAVHLEACLSAESHAFGDANVEIPSAQYKLRENDCACNKQQLYLFSTSNILDTIWKLHALFFHTITNTTTASY